MGGVCAISGRVRRGTLVMLLVALVVPAYAGAAFDFVRKFRSPGVGNFVPRGVAVGPNGDRYLVDVQSGGGTVQVFDQAGVFRFGFGNPGPGDGQFSQPIDVAVAPATGAVYVTDANANRVQRFSAGGDFINKWGGAGILDQPAGITVAPDGSVFVADRSNTRIQHFSASGVSLGGFNSTVPFLYPTSVAAAPDGTLFVTDSGRNNVQQVTTTGTSLRQFGAVGAANGQFATVGNPAGSQVSGPTDIAVASDGTVWVADPGNHRIQHFKANGDFLGAVGSAGTGDGQFTDPPFLALDCRNNVLVSDINIADNTQSRVEEFGEAGPAPCVPSAPQAGSAAGSEAPPIVPGAPQSAMPGARTATRSVVTLGGRAARVTDNVALIDLLCQGNFACEGELALANPSAAAAATKTTFYSKKTKYKVAAGKKAKLKVKLNSKARRLLEKKKKLKVAVQFTPTGGKTTTAKLTLKR